MLRPRSVKDRSSIKKVSRSIKNLPSASTHFEDPCRRFVFAPACRGVTSKRSNEFGKTPELSFPAETYEESSLENQREDGEVSNQIYNFSENIIICMIFDSVGAVKILSFPRI